jgi:hypothetical protein
MFDLDDWLDALSLGSLLVILAMLFVVFAGCGPAPKQIPARFTASPALFDALEDVIAAVNKAAGQTVVAKGADVWVIEAEISDVPPELGPSCGFWDPAKDTIGIVRGCQNPRVLLVHEIGHALGLRHTEGVAEDNGSIMFPRSRVLMTLDEAAASLVAELVAAGLLE